MLVLYPYKNDCNIHMRSLGFVFISGVPIYSQSGGTVFNTRHEEIYQEIFPQINTWKKNVY